MKIAIGADHGGYQLKEKLIQFIQGLGHEIVDVGCDSTKSVDYPAFANAVSEKIIQEEAALGILVCGTGIGMSIAANRYRKIRAANCHNEYTARMSRAHNDANVLCLGARDLGQGVAEGIVGTWLTTEFAGGRHQQRVRQFSD